ncbi:GGDEF domain-containing protein [Chromobacterium haemolyticum]|uniref:GGDEF domain-containing protein n=1 Tax=Chromobacterium haemolyticum TaxID=394935 RepID=UPI0009D99B19|nr:GGDEF domain-containing protein [Chromobacterium haemolyticum]OQS41184.1 GGDEF domain-containing protein [Chromobacterium haemolyticum]
MTTQNPIEVARETLKQLTVRKLLPTPENFERVYHELTQTPVDRDNKLAVLLLRALETLPQESVQAKVTLTRLKQVCDENRWEQAPQLIIDFLRASLSASQQQHSWGTLIQNLIRNWDLRLPNMPQHHKQSTLERVLINYGNQPDELNQKLATLIQNWTQSAPPSNSNGAASSDPPVPAAGLDEDGADAPSDSWLAWQRTLSFALKHGLEPRLINYPELVDALEALLGELNQVADDATLNAYMPKLRAFMIKLELQSQQDDRLVSAMTNLLRLLLENIAELNHTDIYLVGQVHSLQDILSHEPLSMQQVYQMESSLKDVIRKQGQLKTSLDEAASSLRSLLDRFISRLAMMTDSTDDFQNKIKDHSTRIKQSQNVEELGSIIGSLMEDTSLMQLDLTRSRDELLSAKEQVEAAEQRIAELETALEAASAKVREDQLTGAFNRRGLAEHFQREISRAERTGAPLSVALLDVDNFKQLNDKYGHLAGDDALKYLVDTIKHSLRPADIVARFGGEEFVILMPDTPEEEAVATVQRLQRELTKTFFLANNDRLLITFSAGVAKWHLGEQEADVLERADQAMYQAKLNGKNRVHSAEEQPPSLMAPQL